MCCSCAKCHCAAQRDAPLVQSLRLSKRSKWLPEGVAVQLLDAVGVLECVLRQADAEILLQLQRQSTIHHQGLAGDERRFVRAQKHDRVGNVDWLTSTPQRILLFEEAQTGRIALPQ